MKVRHFSSFIAVIGGQSATISRLSASNSKVFYLRAPTYVVGHYATMARLRASNAEALTLLPMRGANVSVDE